MTKEHVYKTILSKLNEMGYKNQEIDENTDIFKDLGLDSLDAVELMTGLEQEYDITIPDEDIANVSKISDIVDMAIKYIK